MENSFFAEVESILESGLPVEVQRAKLRELAPDEVLVDVLTLVMQTTLRRAAMRRSDIDGGA